MAIYYLVYRLSQNVIRISFDDYFWIYPQIYYKTVKSVAARIVDKQRRYD